MGLIQSTQDQEEEERKNEEEAEDYNDNDNDNDNEKKKGLLVEDRKRVLEQEPEVLPCHPSASPLSPQLSFSGSPYMGPTVRVWDPYNILSPVAPLSPSSSFSGSLDHHHFQPCGLEDDVFVEVYLIRHGESTMNERPDIVSGRSPSSGLTSGGKRQARALGVFLKSHGVGFHAVYSSPLDRAKHTALSICQELDIPEDKLECSESLTEMSQGQWEGLLRSEIYTPEMLNIINRLQPDFCAPGGESQRQVEYRMIEFLNENILRRTDFLQRNFGQWRQLKSSGSQTILAQGQQSDDGDDNNISQWELFARQKQLVRRRSGKSRLQYVTTGEDATHEVPLKDGSSGRQPLEQSKSMVHRVAIFTHGMAIKCLLRGLLGSNPAMTHRFCIDNTSMTVLLYSFKSGWQIQRINDTSHLGLL